MCYVDIKAVRIINASKKKGVSLLVIKIEQFKKNIGNGEKLLCSNRNYFGDKASD